MGLAMISIVLYHFHAKTPILWVFNEIGYWGVDVFQFLSGFGCVFALKKYDTVSRFYNKRLLRILPTCLFVGLCIFIIDYNWTNSHGYVPIYARILSLHRWYIPLILTSYILSPFLYVLMDRYGWRALCMILLSCAILGCVISNGDIWRWRWIFFRIAPFAVGMFVSLYDFRVRALHVFVSILLFTIALVYLLLVWPQYYSKLPSEMFALPYSLSLPVIIAGICLVGDKLKNLWYYKTIELLGIYSLEIYLTHEVVVTGLSKFPCSQIIQFILLIMIVTPAVFVTKYGVNKLNSTLSPLLAHANKILKLNR